MAKVGVFGGSFNPIHEGHVNFLKHVKNKLNLDKIILVVCKESSHKNVNLIDKQHRYKMCKLAVSNLNYVEVSKLEFEIKKHDHSIYILQQIKKKYANDELFLIVGPDTFLQISTWHTFNQILHLVKIVSAYSNDDERNQLIKIVKNFNFEAILLRINLLFYNSTFIRIKLAQGLNCSQYLNSKVLEYILKNKLYCQRNNLYLECENVCKNLMSSRRFNHCLLVSKMAGSLAEIYGENVEEACLAGLLHDIVKEQPANELLKIFKLSEISLKNLNEVDRKNPKLWHALAGSIYCKKVLGIENKKILNAIACHTTGKAKMTTFDKIVFIADNTSADRKSSYAKLERKLAFKNLDRALFFHLKNYIQLGCKKNWAIHVNSINCFNELVLYGGFNKWGEGLNKILGALM